jgi:hypothetical protein
MNGATCFLPPARLLLSCGSRYLLAATLLLVGARRKVRSGAVGQFTDLSGQRFGRLLVLRRGENRGRRITWLCQCTCGRRKVFVTDYLTSKNYRSCGCLRDEMTRKRATTHGATRGRQHTKEYRAWRCIKGRCYNPSDPRYPNCGGQGIKMYRPWRSNFLAFLRDLGPASPNTILKRLDLDRDFEPGNCCWQLRSKRKTKRPKFRRKR